MFDLIKIWLDGFWRSAEPIDPAARDQFFKALELYESYTVAPSAARLPHLLEAVRLYEGLLVFHTEHNFPRGLASVQNNLAAAYVALPTGDRGRNLERAIAGYEAALRVYTERDFPADWAMTQHNLALAYWKLPGGDRGRNLERTIACYESALRVHTERSFPGKWAETQHNLALAYAQLSTGDKAQNLNRAVTCCQAALRVNTEQDSPSEWATIQHNLAKMFVDFSTENRALKPEVKSQLLKSAIDGFESVLRIFTLADFPMQWAMTQNNLAIALAKLPTGDKTRNLKRAIASCEAALDVYTERGFPVDWAMVQKNLANVYLDMAEDKTGNLERAISCCEAALRVYTERDFPAEWAMVQNHLALAYTRLRNGDRARNLERAIGHCEAALRIYIERDFPAEWAGTQSNLASAYAELPVGDRLRNLELAIGGSQAALRVYTERDFPAEWAALQNNLAVVYKSLPSGDRKDNLHEAIARCAAALRVYTELDSPADWAHIQNTLGTTYRSLTLAALGQNWEQAIACYEAALRVYNEREFPNEWAATQNNLANVYEDLPGGNRERNLQRAIAGYESVLRIYSKDEFPLGYAMVQNNLAKLYASLSAGANAEHLARAITLYEAALQVRTERDFPSDCLRTLQNLAALFFDVGSFDRALDRYTEAIGVSERIRHNSLDDSGRRLAMWQSHVSFERGMLCATRTGKFTLALTLAERGKTRNLADHLWRRDTKPRGVSGEDWSVYQRYLQEARTMEQMHSSSARELAEIVRDVALLHQSAELHRRTREMEVGFAATDPDYVPFAAPLDMAALSRLAECNGAVLVDFRITSEESYVFLVGPGDAAVDPKQAVTLAGVTNESLRTLVDDWMSLQLRGTDWKGELDVALGRLYKELLAPVHRRLIERYSSVKRLIIIPSQALALLPLHAAWWESADGNRCYLLDEYEVTFAPSALVLERCLKREVVNPQPKAALFAVQNPDGSLPFADWEVEEIAMHFPQSNRIVLKGAAANRAEVEKKISFGSEKLFSTHGWFDPADPDKSHLKLADGELALPDILRTDLRGTWLVVLSACVTGLVDFKTLDIDEFLGLPAAFLVAGAQTVVVSLWSVSDIATALLMRQFHRNLYAECMEKAESLRAAQRWLRDLSEEEAKELLGTKRGDPISAAPTIPRMATTDAVQEHLHGQSRGPRRPFAHPYYWAAFQCIGAGWKAEPK